MSNGTPPAKRRRVDGDIITLVAGSKTPSGETRSITIHDSVLRDRSDFFKAALSKQWKEGQQCQVELPEDEPEIILAYRDFLYNGTLDSMTALPRSTWSYDQIQDENLYLTKIFVFGEKLQDPALCNAAVRSIIEIADFRDYKITKTGYYPPETGVIKVMYEGTPEGSPARKLMVDIFLTNCKPEWLEKEDRKKAYECPEFLCDLAYILVTKESGVDKRKLGPDSDKYLKKT